MIKFESVSKTFRDGTAAVVDLTLTVPTGKITVIVGPSGCGKTTTLRMINRMIEPTSGRILWDGTPLKSRRKTALRRQMGYVIQSGGLFPHRTVVENIGTVPGLLHWSKDKTQQRSQELLGNVGLDRKLAHRYPAQLSGGQQQRVGVARALAADPLVLLMDEPFSAVDPVVRSELHDFFLGLQRQISKTIVLITHDIDEAIKLGDQVAIMRVGGRLAQYGTPQQVLDEPADAFVEGFVGKDRGYRSLSFLPASNLELEKVKVVRDVEAAEAGEPTLVIDEDARPVGWANSDRPGQVFPLGSTFNPESDTLRAALDSALTSLYGLAVAVAPETGRFAGVATAEKILEQVAGARAAVAESISVRAAEETMRRSGPQSPPDGKATKSPADKQEERPDAEADEAPAAVRPESVEGQDVNAASPAPATKVESAADANQQESESAPGDKQTATTAAAVEPAPAVGDEPKAGSTAARPQADSEAKAPETIDKAAAKGTSAGSTETASAPA
ncbi:MAG TPA: ATP-binding cassette domain-containing protein, partial [Propionibacteriaceae bacterium]|nr:ATP-binding cassette domain-containing protein [Propionibacteriaceae bacterium]